VTLDVVVPALRRETIELLLESLALNTVAPDAVSIVGAEIDTSLAVFGLPVRLLRVRSDRYPIGDWDLALRRDVGVWFSECTHVLLLDDDLVASATLVEDSLALLKRQPFFWGHHRYIDFAPFTVAELSRLEPGRGRAREQPPNAWHLWMSCYGGLFGASRDVVVEAGGFDIAFSGRSGEDQGLGKRLAHQAGNGERVFVHEPPFAWHPEPGSPPWGERHETNICADGHAVVDADIAGASARRCTRCPWFRVIDVDALLAGKPLLPFDPGGVEISVELPLARA